MNERDLERQVKELAKLFDYKYYHTWRSIHSPAGFPDCALARLPPAPPRLIFAELKSDHGKLSPEQIEWLNLLAGCRGTEVYLWKPADFEEIAEILRCNSIREIPRPKSKWSTCPVPGVSQRTVKEVR
jgi:hypothetical protein